ncbi:hypothetical protein GLOTRDRAFT_129783 [Gloeophyllum trabeum ATCC 11539]|uniref:Uncharacterized protein n=1 Tax=Gloeophyllum trabeum (strain ATCC 11539 / FP-39264 / Madison 617) TaxID=670483 RepID=S7Q4L4_GLOTA|nr:uncharacterized protein GLOTRDRAFT_129783 [Gloeophyllum trabeum ATCC 11539]EPQ54423.1 hypothetical protein GLOTRDRAFT_129783 [Gloeophyllum trabeum ATCC 11539]
MSVTMLSTTQTRDAKAPMPSGKSSSRRLPLLRMGSKAGAEGSGKLEQNCKLYPVLHVIPMSRDDAPKANVERQSPSPPNSADGKSESHFAECARSNTLKKSRHEVSRSLPVNYGSTQHPQMDPHNWIDRQPKKAQSVREHGMASYDHPSSSSRGRELSHDRPSLPRHGHSWHHTTQHSSDPSHGWSRNRVQAGVDVSQRPIPSRSALAAPTRPDVKRAQTQPQTQTRSSSRDSGRPPAPTRPVPRKAATMPAPSTYIRTPLSDKPQHAQAYNLPSPKLASVSARLNESKMRAYDSHPLPPTPMGSRQNSGQPGPMAPPLARRNAISQSGRQSRSSNRM